jgi:hypothetical protein
MSRDQAFTKLYNEYLPLRLYADHRLGSTPQELAEVFSLPIPWVEERIEAVRLCVEKQVRLDFLLPDPAPELTPAAA